MSLAPGTRVGHYEILAPLGAGGMGEVFRARDTKLNRDVAIKMLPESVANDPVRLARFEREARTLAALNHPHIAQIYGLEDAASRGKALVMELVPGQTLAERAAGGPIPAGEALDIARQIADALDCAHTEGIVHRDLKPANIKVRDDGAVKVLDFGLAKGGDSGAVANLQDSPTFTSPAMTERGIILGTAAYMSPEQARGRPVDKRADIWALGVILFEMLTGRQLFAGETVSDTLAAVLREEVPWSALPPATPQAVRRLLERLLQKDPRRRLRDVGDAKLEIEDAIAGRDTAAARIPEASAPPRSRRLPWAVAAIAAAAALAAAGWAITGRRGGEPIGELRFTQITDIPGEETMPALSPDGTTVAFAARVNGSWDLFSQRVGGRNRVTIAGDPNRNETGPVFSPDGQRLAFFELDDDGGIFVAGATGESVRRVADSGFHPAWSPDGRSLAFSTEEIYNPYSRTGTSVLRAVDLESGAVRPITEPETFDGAQPVWSPSGSRIAFWSNTNGQRDLYTVAASGGAPVPLLVDVDLDWCPAWSHDGRYVIFASDRGGSMNLWRIGVDESTGQPRGIPEPITTGVQASAELPSFSADGTRLAFRSRVGSVNPIAIPFDPAALRAGQPAQLASANGMLVPADVSPDGRLLSLFMLGSRQEDILLTPLDAFAPRRITDDAPRDRTPVFTPDGRSLLFYSTRGGTWEAWRIDIDGGGLRKLASDNGPIVYPLPNPAGDRIVYTRAFDTGLVIRPLDGDPAKPPAPLPGTGELMATGWSRDGHRLAGSLIPASGRPAGVAVYDLRSAQLKTLSRDATFWVAWLDNDRLLYFTTAKELVVLHASSGARTVVDVTLPLPPTDDAFAIARDGRTIYYGGERSESDIWIAERVRR